MKLSHKFFVLFGFSLSIAFIAGNTFGEQQDSVIQDIEDIISQGEAASYENFEAIKTKIEEKPEKFLSQLLAKTERQQLPEPDLAIYIWAIGLTKSPKAFDHIIKLSSGKKSEQLLRNSYKALLSTGGERAGEYLSRQLEKTSDHMMRYQILDLLAQIQYTPALPKTIEILKQDPSQYYWKTIFVFGKYGNTAVPFLLDKIGDKDQTIRINAIMALGQWLIPIESLNPLKDQFWRESIPQLRGLILGSLEKVNTDLNDIKAFSMAVIERETDENIVAFARETVRNYEQMASHVENFRSQKIHDRAAFDEEYNKILNSFGKHGNYEKLSSLSSKDDETKLRKLKETILQRNSDECFYDYEKINNIIILNRLM